MPFPIQKRLRSSYPPATGRNVCKKQLNGICALGSCSWETSANGLLKTSRKGASIQNAQKANPGCHFPAWICLLHHVCRIKESIPLQSSILYSDLFYPLWLLPISSPFSKASLFRGSSLGFFPSLCSIVPHTTSGETTSVYPM